MDRTKLRPILKVISILPAIVLGMLLHYFVGREYGIYLLGASESNSFIMLFGQIVVFYFVLQLLIFRGKYWTRFEFILALVVYSIVLFAGLIFRGSFIIGGFSLVDQYIWNRVELNPFSFIQDFMVDRDSLKIAFINVMLFIPLPLLLFLNRMKPRYWAALTLFVLIELMQLVLGQGIFSLGDIILYFVGFLLGIALLKIIHSKINTVADLI